MRFFLYQIFYKMYVSDYKYHIFHQKVDTEVDTDFIINLRNKN